MNPFEDEIEDMNVCKGVENCPRLIADFRRFSNAPPPLPLQQVRGSVVLVAGCKSYGKSVYGHRLLHEYQAEGLAPLELLDDGPFDDCPARQKDVLRKLCSKTGLLDADDMSGAEFDKHDWAAKLSNVMSQAGGEMVVRLPGMMPNASGVAAAELAWEVFRYAAAANRSKSVFIYEYNAKDWPRDWELLRAAIEENNDHKVRTRVLEPFTPDELWAYAEEIMDVSPHQEITLEESVPGSLRSLFGHRFGDPSLHLKSVHQLMRRSFANAIEGRSATVTFDHLWPAVELLGSERP
ncbi:hypothetical protein ACH35V_23315 [Actinomadura sp. 1N219]|uniref:hypothetical protein n=1 Tax=Actinomadura sp. 1N219 TaxID=3375152 RepID=UPI0037BBF0CF